MTRGSPPMLRWKSSASDWRGVEFSHWISATIEDMAPLSSWTTSTREPLKRHAMVHMVASQATTGLGVDWAAGQIPDQYAGPDRVAAILAKLGKPDAAEYLVVRI